MDSEKRIKTEIQSMKENPNAEELLITHPPVCKTLYEKIQNFSATTLPIR